MGPKLKRYRETIASYKELKQKIAKRIFDVEDAKEVTVDIGAVILPDEESALLGDLRDDEDTRAKLMMVSYRSPLDHLANFESVYQTIVRQLIGISQLPLFLPR